MKNPGSLIEYINQFTSNEAFTHFLIFAISILLAIVAYLIGFVILRSLRKHAKSAFLTEFRKRFKIISFILFINIAVLIPFTAYNYSNVYLQGLFHFFKLSFIAVLTAIAIKSIHIIREIILQRLDINQSDNLKIRSIYTQLDILKRIIIALIIIFALAISLMTFDSIRQIGVSIFASAGVAGIILGLAAQKVIGSFLAGVQIAITQPIRLDDVVIVENEWGRIEEINLTYVVVKIWDQRRLVLPATYFIENPFQNWTRTTAELLGTVFIYTDYKVPYNALRDEFFKNLEKTSLWNKKVKVLQVTDAKESTVEIRLLMSANDSPTLWDLRVLIREKMLEFLQKNYPESLPRSRVEILEK